jgi:hypothetical protein
MLALFSCVFGAIDARAGNVYGTSSVIYDFANNRTRGYSRTQVDYETAEYYTAYVCGELYKDGVYQVRACQSGMITATIYTQYTGTSGTGYVLSDHYVDMKYFDEEQSSYVDDLGYRFSSGSYPGDWFFYPANIFGYFNPVSIHLGSTHFAKPTVTTLNLPFAPTFVSLGGDPVSTGKATISTSSFCSNDPGCLHEGDKVVVEIIQNTSGGTFSFEPESKIVEIPLTVTPSGPWDASFIVKVLTAPTPPALPRPFQFTIRVLDVIRPNEGSILTSVQLVPPAGGQPMTLEVRP